jgi:hypothetical protein|tara:strand:+ start:29 stop:250 length:222 start_codon:yes stop_codon:yes gene_type:complete
MSKKKEDKSKKVKKKPEKSVFNKKSEAGKGDKLRRGISQDEWGKKYEKIFKSKKNKKHPLVDEIKDAYKNTNK